jgi:nitric oxide reductase large subunit
LRIAVTITSRARAFRFRLRLHYEPRLWWVSLAGRNQEKVMKSKNRENRETQQVTLYHWGVALFFSVSVFMGWKFGMELFS